MQPFSEESLHSFTDSTQTFEDFEKEEKKKISPPHCESVSCHPSPHQNPSLSVKAPGPTTPNPLPLPRLARSTNRAASDRQWHSFSSTHSPCGWEAQQSVPVGSFLPSQYPFQSNSQTRPLEISENLEMCLRTQMTPSRPIFSF